MDSALRCYAGVYRIKMCRANKYEPRNLFISNIPGAGRGPTETEHTIQKERWSENMPVQTENLHVFV